MKNIYEKPNAKIENLFACDIITNSGEIGMVFDFNDGKLSSEEIKPEYLIY